MSGPNSTARTVLALAALHAALVGWALRAWIHGPFQGEGILDGAEVLALARTGSPGAFQTKSPLYPALLQGAFEVLGDSPWTIGLLGLALSLATLLAVDRMARALGRPEAAPWAVGLYTFSGSAIVFAIQPLPAMLSTALLAWGSLAALHGTRCGRPSRGLLAGALLGASAFASAPHSIPALLVGGWLGLRRRWAATAAAAAGVARVARACLAAFGARAWPTGSMLNLRLGNGGARSGICEVRPGPAYDRVRLEAAFAGSDLRGSAPDFERFQRDALGRELRADPLGALATLLCKGYLSWFRTETVTDSDFRHGLRGFPLAVLWLSSFGWIAALALASLLRWRPAALWVPVAGVLAVNVLWLTSARYRFPALPFSCVAAGAFVASRPGLRAWAAAALIALPLNVNLSGRALLVPGDGLVQEGRMWLARDRLAPRAAQALEQAITEGSRDPRARYELALISEARGEPESAEERYREALELDPLYPEAAENLVALLLAQGRVQAAIEVGDELSRSSPFAGKVWLNLASARRVLDPDADVRELEAQGCLRLALRALAHGDEQAARRWAAQARARGLDDPRLPAATDV